MDELRAFIAYVAGDHDLLALVMLNGTEGGRFCGRTAVGFYRDRDKFYADAERFCGCGNLYVNLNQLNPDLYGRSSDRVKFYSPTRFTDAEITRRRLLLVDCDPVRLAGINSTDEEVQNAIDASCQVIEYLKEQWSVEPLHLMSGNGSQLLYSIDEPVETPLVKHVLCHLHDKFSSDKVKIDTSVCDAARITRLAGTLNMKGDDVPGRPRRYSRLLSVPAERCVVTTDHLSMLAPAPSPMPSDHANRSKGSWTHEKLRDVLDKKYKAYGGHGWEYRVEAHSSLGTLYKLQQCPFMQHHVEYRSALWLNDGVLCYKCFSDDCDGANKKTGRDFVQLIAPEPPLALTDELRLARHMVTLFSCNGMPTIRYFRGNWFLWDGCWRIMEEDRFSYELYANCKKYILDEWPPDLLDKNGNPKTAPKLGKQLVANVTLALKSLVSVQETGWVDNRCGRWLAFRDQILDLDGWLAGDVICVPQTPEYFAPTSLNYPLVHTTEEPTLLLDKLREQMTDGEVEVLQEFGGYCLTDDTSIQRILYMTGPPRSFKGTFERVIRATVGEHNTVSKTFAAFLGPHALENVPGKTFLAISDSRPDPKLSRQAVERLLSISGEDPQDINPKGKPAYTTKLACKIGIASNVMADFADPTGALLSRFLFVETTKSYAANPDCTLLERILTQQNEITWWFLRGLRRLLQNGKYSEPTNNLGKRFQIQNNPIASFVSSECDVTGKPEHKLGRDDLYSKFESWCVDRQVANYPENNIFFRDLYSAFPKVKAHERYVSGIMFLAV